MSWRYESIIASKDAIIALYKEKLSGASPTEAKAKIDALQAQIDRLVAGRWPPLTNEQAQLIRSELKGLSHQRIVLMNDDADGRDLEKSFIVVFEELGWTTRQDRLAFGRAAEGITIFPKTVASAQLTEAMEKHTGFKVLLKQQGPPGDEDIHILIGPRPR